MLFQERIMENREAVDAKTRRSRDGAFSTKNCQEFWIKGTQ
jgi:hypothetical protein